jgi:hypothetical protein
MMVGTGNHSYHRTVPALLRVFLPLRDKLRCPL